MRFTDQSKVLREDIKSAPSWIDVILLALNTLIQNFYNLVNNNIDDSNIKCQNKVITFTTLPTYPTDFTVIKFPNTMKIKATSCNIQQCVEKTTATGVATFNPGWNENNSSIVINSILGLQPSTTYTIRFRLT